MPVPNSFANVTTSIPLSQLDANFNTPITLGNTAIQLGNTVTTLNNMTLANVTISSGNVTASTATISGNVTLSGGTANAVAYLNGSKVVTTGTALQFDGTNLGVGGSPTISGVEISRATGAASPTPVELRLKTTTNDSGWSTTSPWGRISFYSDDASIGGAKIQASIQATAQSSAGGNSNLDFFVTDTANGTLFRTMSFQGSGTNKTQTAFYSGGGTNTMTLEDTGHLRIVNGNVIIGTAGQGIDFSADANAATSTSELLDDYEEGTFTPTISFGGSSSGVAYSIQAGSYTKIGQVVYFTLRMSLTSNGSGTGQATIGSLPFTANVGSSGVRYQCKVFPLTLSGVTGEVTAQAGSGTATLDLYYGSSTYTSITETNYPDAGDCIVTGFYIV